MSAVVVVGAGPGGMMAAGRAAELGAEAFLLEKNDRVGRKLLITGKGRCNLTNAGDIQDFIDNINNGQFLYSSLAEFSNMSLLEFFSKRGLETKVERGRRVFPATDKARDVVDILSVYLQETGVKLRTGITAKSVIARNRSVSGVRLESGEDMPATAVVLATGGVTYPATGSTGDGLRMAAAIGHSVVTPRPSLVPLEVGEQWPASIAGLALRNVLVTLRDRDKILSQDFGEMLFTHTGVSGPTILTLSRAVVENSSKNKSLTLEINLKPALTPEQLDRRVQRDFQTESRRQFKNSLAGLLPNLLIPVIIQMSGISPEKPVNQISRGERLSLVNLLQHLKITITGTRPIDEAIITAGGISIREINPKTMESRLIKGLYFAGEIIDVDGKTGGYNLQAAFSTGYVAGMHAASARVKQ